MRWEQPIRYASVSDIGFRRRNNQDSCAIRICSDQQTWREHGHLLMVADGMGGHAVGELASKIAADTVCHTFFKLRDLDVVDALQPSLETANATINERGSLNRDFARMGTTCTSLVLCSQGAVIGHVGDSRAYRIRGDRIDQLTFDHSLHWELMRQGRMRPDDVFHARIAPRDYSLAGSRSRPCRSTSKGPYPVLPGDVYLLCSDGLTGHVQDAEIGIIARELPPQEACRLLVNLANLRGGSDNITVVAVQVGGAGDDTEPEEEPPAPPGGMGVGLATRRLVFGPRVCRGRDGHPLQQVPRKGSISSPLPLLVRSAHSLTGSRSGRGQSHADPDLDGTETTVWKPYRTASARSSVAFLTIWPACRSNCSGRRPKNTGRSTGPLTKRRTRRPERRSRHKTTRRLWRNWPKCSKS